MKRVRLPIGEPMSSDKPLRLLVCDDDMAVMVQLAIALDDVELVETSRQIEAETAVMLAHVDAAVIDRRMPDGDGLALVRALRATPASAGIPIVVLTAGYRPEDREEVLAAGADEYVGKPFEPLVLADLLRRLLATDEQKRRVRRTLQRARARAGQHPGGWDDLAELEAPAVVAPSGRWARRRG